MKKLRKILKARNANLSNLKTNIANSKLVIEFLGVVEYYIDLSLEEWNFREILRADLLTLLEQQRIYWRQRGALKWVKLIDAGTKFFLANATIRHRNNFISRLSSNDGNILTSHAKIEQLLWETFKSRLGTTELCDM